ncbi:GDSL-like Lipase/Acylhydrolase [Musa troglodytarum]|uniref:GDSL-like Lipase/Acylhydrolase n=1 Tax=Musa troglodytarum TaxID=320322 RepID=A0A9E7GF09_9LILI|nr:GDSL-like Lipase/Acylhydrolase [Musa troglodytarum]
MLPPIASILIGSLLLQLTAASAPCAFPAIFNFGDSNSDTGGLSSAFGQAPPPNGETFFRKPAGRYCDGRLLIDFIANSSGLPRLNAYLDSVGTNFSHGANFATAGSTIRPQNTPFSLDVQTWQFSQFKSRSQSFLDQGLFKDQLPKKEYFSRALYTLDIGQNDLTAGYFSNMTSEEVKASIPDILDKFSIAVKVILLQSIYGEGGRFFWVHNTGPLGCLAYVLDRLLLRAPEVDRFGCGSPFNEVAQLFNTQLEEAVAQLREDLPLAVFTLVDVYSVKYELISHATKHGFELPLVACCGHGGKYNYNAHNGCGSKITKSCKDPSKRIIWDGVHYTEAANRWVFDQIAEGSSRSHQLL